MADPTFIPLPDFAEAVGSDVLKVRQMLGEGVVLGRRGQDGVLRIPAEFAAGGEVLKGLTGTLILLRDNGFDEHEALDWLFAPDDSLTGGSPVAALAALHTTEVRRRAQALG